jgi:prolyl-tRNA synthetase
VVLMPIFRNPAEQSAVMDYVGRLAEALRSRYYHGRRLGVEIDDRDIGGARGWEWIKKGIPIRVEIGPRDIADDAVFCGRRDKPHRDRASIPRERFIDEIDRMLDEIQENLFQRALSFRQQHTRRIDDKQEFVDFFTPRNREKPEIHGGFSLSHWCGSSGCEADIKDELGVTIRCVPLDGQLEGIDDKGRCVYCGGASAQRVVFAKAY